MDKIMHLYDTYSYVRRWGYYMYEKYSGQKMMVCDAVAPSIL